MAIEYICDGCGKREPAKYGAFVAKPENWFSRADEKGEQHACSRACVDKVSKRNGKTPLVVPL